MGYALSRCVWLGIVSESVTRSKYSVQEELEEEHLRSIVAELTNRLVLKHHNNPKKVHEDYVATLDYVKALRNPENYNHAEIRRLEELAYAAHTRIAVMEEEEFAAADPSR